MLIVIRPSPLANNDYVREMPRGRVLRTKFIIGHIGINVPPTRVGLTINPGLFIHNSNATQSYGDLDAHRPLI